MNRIGRRQFLRYGAAAGTGLLLPRYGLLRPRRAHAATIFNVHYNLSAWPQNTGLAVGARRSNGGNAYHVITPGTTANTPGAGPTGTGADITDGTVHWKYLSAIDYADLQSWANAMPGTQSVDYEVRLWNNGTITTAGTTPFMHYVATAGSFSTLITCASGEGLTANRSAALTPNQANGVLFQAPSSGTALFPYFILGATNTTFRGIQYVDPQSANNIAFQMGVDNCRLEGCIIDAWQPYYTALNNCGMVNSLIISRKVGNDFIWPAKWDTASTGAYIVNCTMVQAGDGGSGAMAVHLNAAAAAGIVRNSAFFGPGSTHIMSQNGSGGTWVVDHCGFNMTAAAEFSSPALGVPNTDAGGNLPSLVAANQFVDASTNFRLKRGSALINAAATDLTNIPAANDIFGVARPQSASWDIGAQEFSSAAGGLLLSGVG